MHFPDRDAQVYADGEGGGASEESRQHEQSPQELSERRNVAGPGGQPQAGHEFGVVMQTAEDFVGAMHDHNGTQSKAYDKKRKWLQAFEVAHESSKLSVTRLPQITSEECCLVAMNQQDDCVAAELLVTFFRPPRESYMLSESTAGSTSLAGAARLPFQGWQQSKFARAVPRRRSVIQCLQSPVFACGSVFGLPGFLRSKAPIQN